MGPELSVLSGQKDGAQSRCDMIRLRAWVKLVELVDAARVRKGIADFP